MRMGELFGVKWEDDDWASNTIYVRRQLQRIPRNGKQFSPPKTNAGRRVIELGPAIMDKLGEHKKRQEIEQAKNDWEDFNLIFLSLRGTPAEQTSLHRYFKSILKVAGLPNMRFHDLRHTAATLMLMNNIPIMVVLRRLGHTKPSITLDINGHFLSGTQKEVAN